MEEKPASVKELRAHGGLTRRTSASLAANFRHLAANRRQMAAFCGFGARRLVRKTVSMEALKSCSAINHRARMQIRTRVQSLAGHSSATRSTGGASFDMKSESAEST